MRATGKKLKQPNRNKIKSHESQKDYAEHTNDFALTTGSKPVNQVLL